MSRILLGVTGSVAAMRTPLLYEAMTAAGHTVRLVATGPSLYFFDPAVLAPCEPGARSGPVHRDADEWPPGGYRRGDPVLHIELRKWADVLVVAPLDANTLAKFAVGLCDNLLSCVFRAWDFSRPVVLAPAMNTLMWESPITLRHLRGIAATFGTGGEDLPPFTLDEAAEAFARSAPRIVIVPPQAKRLACGDFGVGAMAEVAAIAEAVRRWSEDLPSDGREADTPLVGD